MAQTDTTIAAQARAWQVLVDRKTYEDGQVSLNKLPANVPLATAKLIEAAERDLLSLCREA